MNTPSEMLDRPPKRLEQVGLSPQEPNTGTEDVALDIGALWDTVRRSKWLILGTCALVAALAVGITVFLPRVYEASSVVSVEEPSTQRTGPLTPWPDGRSLRSEVGTLENSGELARRVLETIQARADTMGQATFTLLLPDEGETSVSEYDMRVRLHSMVRFEANGDQELIMIRVQSQDPHEAAVIANVYASEYKRFSQETARSSVVAARDFLEGQLEKRKEEMWEVEREWEVFARNNGVVTDGVDGQNVAREYAELQSRRDALRFQREQEQRTLSTLRSRLEQAEPDLRSSVLEEQRVRSLRTQIQSLENQIANLKTQAEQYYMNNPSLRGNESEVGELADLTRRIDGFEARKMELTEELVEASQAPGAQGGSMGVGEESSGSIGQMASLRNRIEDQELRIDQLDGQIQGLENRIAGYQGRLANIPRQTIQHEQLTRRLAQAEQFYSDIAMELQRTIVTEESELGYVTVVRSAVAPLFPVSPNPKQNVILGLLLGLGLGLGLAFIRQAMDWQIYDPRGLQARGYSLVGVIPDMKRELKRTFKGKTHVDVDGLSVSTSLFPLLSPWSPITENYRLVRANLQFATMKDGGDRSDQSTWMITSPEPGDGKTTTAANLAITTALSGRSVLLIDADLRRPNLHKLFGIDRGPGLGEILTGSDVGSSIQRVLISGLSVLSAGNTSVPPTELLNSGQMRRLLRTVSKRFDVVIVDTPPVLAATDLLVLAPYFDVVMVVVAADKTDFRALDRVRETLNGIGVPIGGVIFNGYDVEHSVGGNTYSYGYDYEYEYLLTE